MKLSTIIQLTYSYYFATYLLYPQQMDPWQRRGERGKYKMIIKEFRIAHTAEYPIYTMKPLVREF